MKIKTLNFKLYLKSLFSDRLLFHRFDIQKMFLYKSVSTLFGQINSTVIKQFIKMLSSKNSFLVF